MDNMFILISGFHNTDPKSTIENRISETLRTSAISITITSLTDIIAFCIGATSPFTGARNFCIYTGVAICFCYFNQLTFFTGCLVMHARRVESVRHCITCLRTRSKEELDQNKEQKLWILFCHGSAPTKKSEEDSPCDKIPVTIFNRYIMSSFSKTLVMFFFAVYLVVCSWGASNIKTGSKVENMIHKSSYLFDYYDVSGKYFNLKGPYIMIILRNHNDLFDESLLHEIDKIYEKIWSHEFADKNSNSKISWLDDFLQYESNASIEKIKQNFNQKLKKFLFSNPQFKNDIYLEDTTKKILASRFYVQSRVFDTIASEEKMMTTMQEIASNSTLDLTVYSTHFIYYEEYVSILKNTLLSVGVAIIGMIFIALMFIPNLIAVTCVTFSMISIVIGMFGFMYFWDLSLSAITKIQIILSVGFCVDFTVHISHAFLCATGKNRNERVIAALDKIGIPILNGALSSILGILMLIFASSYIYTSFFKTMLLVILLGLVHSLLILPVILSFIGPRRTSKPKIFIPISDPNKRPPGAAQEYQKKLDLLHDERINRTSRSTSSCEQPHGSNNSSLDVQSPTYLSNCENQLSDKQLSQEKLIEDVHKRRASFRKGKVNASFDSPVPEIEIDYVEENSRLLELPVDNIEVISSPQETASQPGSSNLANRMSAEIPPHISYYSSSDSLLPSSSQISSYSLLKHDYEKKRYNESNL